MTVMHTLFRGVGSYALAQVATGVELGVLIAAGVLLFDWGPGTIAAVMPAGLGLVALQTMLFAAVWPTRRVEVAHEA
jgi:hypothetical protein